MRCLVPTRILIWVGLILTFLFLPVNEGVAQTCVAPPPGLVSWWTADGTANDLVGANDGTLQGAATFGPGKVGGAAAFSFDGVDDFINVADNANLKFGAEESITIDAWIRTTKFGVQRIVSKQSENSANHYFLRVQADGTVLFQIADNFPSAGGFVQLIGTTVVDDGNFHHVGGVRDRGTNTVRLYVDGNVEAAAPDTTTGPIDGGTNPLTIGTLFFTILGPQPEFFEGLIDEVEIFNRALSAAEIQAIFDAGSAGKCKVPVPLGHFNCYDVKIPIGDPKFEEVDVTLSDQFREDLERTVKKPKLLCTPVDKNGEGIINPESHLVCYDVKKPKGMEDENENLELEVLVDNQFGEQVLEVKKLKRLCVPSTKEIIE